MFIPVSLGQGTTSVDCTVDVTGVLVAQCAALYEGTSYAAGASIAVMRNKTIRFTTDISAYAEISVTLAGKQYYWFVDLPKSLRYVVDQAYKRITGTTYGKLYHYPSGTSVPFADTGNLAAGDVVAAIDYIKKDIWFFNKNAQVKKVTIAESPVAVVFAPRWSLADGVATSALVVADGKVYRLTSTFALDTSFAIEAGCKGATGNLDGNLVLMYDTKLVILNPTTGLVVETIDSSQGFSALQNVFVLHDNSIITAGNGGIKQTVKSGATWATTTLLAVNGQYQSFDLGPNFLYVVDGTNRCVRALSLTDWKATTVYFDQVPRSVTVHDTDVYVGFYTSTTSLQFSQDLSVSTPVTTVKTYGAAYLNDYVVTDLYTDVNDVTQAEADVAPTALLTENFTVGQVVHFEWTCTFPRPEFVRVGTNSGTVKVNGVTFTSGYLAAGDVVAFDLPATATYYSDRWVALVGRRSVSFGFRTEPRLFPDAMELPRILEAIPRQEYYFDYYITGITDGFSVDVVSAADETEVSFSVNDSAYDFTGTIKTGDHISVRAIPKGLLTQRVAHVTKTTPGDRDVYSLTILPMTLNGVEIRRDKIDVQSQYSQVANPDINKPNVLSPFDAERQTYKTLRSDMPTSEVQRHRGLVFTAQGMSPELIQAPQFYGDGATSKLATSPTSWFIDAYSAVKMLHRAVPMEAEGTFQMQQPGNWSAIQGEFYKKPTLNSTWYTFTPPEWTKSEQSESWSFKSLPFKWHGSHPYYIDSNIQVYRIGDAAEVNAVYDVRVLLHVAEVDALVYPQTLRHVEPIDWSYEFLQVFNAHEIDASWERVLPLAGHLIDAHYGKETLNHYKVDASYERAGMAALHEFSAEPVRVIPNVLLLDKPAPQFVVQTPDFVLPDLASGFGDQAQAEDYASDIGVAPATFFEISGKWIFISEPTAETAACTIVVVPPDKQKRFGYIGGG